MEEIFFITEERKKQLDKILEKEIADFKNNTISREEFVLYIDMYIKLEKISFCDVIYLVNTYLGPVKIIDENRELLKRIELLDDEIYFVNECDIDYNIPQKTIIPKIKDVKRIKKYENMASKGKKSKKRKK